MKKYNCLQAFQEIGIQKFDNVNILDNSKQNGYQLPAGH